jgi:hypothetical protein
LKSFGGGGGEEERDPCCGGCFYHLEYLEN